MPPILGATVPDLVTFVLCAIIVLSGAAGVIVSRNAVHAALSLVLTLFGVAVLFVEQHAYFLAAVQVIVYAGAIVVLFLFVIMFLGVDREENVWFESLKGQRPLALLFVAVALGGVLALLGTAHWVTGAHHVAGSTTAGHHSDAFLLGKSIFTTYLWAFEITAGLLVIAVVGAVVLARRPTRAHDADALRPAPPGAAPAGPQEQDDRLGTTVAAGTSAAPGTASDGMPAGAPGSGQEAPAPAGAPHASGTGS